MSQRKEKYLRQSLEQYDNIARDVDYLTRKVPELERDLGQLRAAHYDMAAEARRRIERRKRERQRRERRRKAITRAAAMALLLALLVTLIAIVAGRAAVEDAEVQETEPQMATEIAVPVQAVVDLLASSAPVATEAPEPELTAEDMLKMHGAYCEEIPMPAEDQLALLVVCQEFSIPYYLALGLIDVETDFRNIAGDNGYSVGYMQVQQRYHQDRMDELGVTDLWDPRGNFRVGLYYLGEMIYRYEDVSMGLMAYNMGATGASKHWEKGVMTSEYSEKVLASAEAWKSALGW